MVMMTYAEMLEKLDYLSKEIKLLRNLSAEFNRLGPVAGVDGERNIVKEIQEKRANILAETNLLGEVVESNRLGPTGVGAARMAKIYVEMLKKMVNIKKEMDQLLRNEDEDAGFNQLGPVAPAPSCDTLEPHLGSDQRCRVCYGIVELDSMNRSQERDVPGSTVIEMPCNHIYHSDCIVPWLVQNNAGPISQIDHELQPNSRKDLIVAAFLAVVEAIVLGLIIFLIFYFGKK